MCADALSASRKQTESVAELRRGFVDDERTVQTREDEVPNESVLPQDDSVSRMV